MPLTTTGAGKPSGAFTPAAIATGIGWWEWKAPYAFTDAGKTIPAADGLPVHTVTDRLGLRDWVQSDSAKRPVFTVAGAQSFGRWDGVNDNMLTTGPKVAEYVALFRCRQAGGFGSYGGWINPIDVGGARWALTEPSSVTMHGNPAPLHVVLDGITVIPTGFDWTVNYGIDLTVGRHVIAVRVADQTPLAGQDGWQLGTSDSNQAYHWPLDLYALFASSAPLTDPQRAAIRAYFLTV